MIPVRRLVAAGDLGITVGVCHGASCVARRASSLLTALRSV